MKRWRRRAKGGAVASGRREAEAEAEEGEGERLAPRGLEELAAGCWRLAQRRTGEKRNCTRRSGQRSPASRESALSGKWHSQSHEGRSNVEPAAVSDEVQSEASVVC
ncbi:hypothetical protein Dda_7948 [Drechslerella dactyloides]|uniref:Uncharacterized protein n=1 Tax=Drechslerella dactyloides TaxID=74499 RepID=A0AAD6NG89_DREDA|nr:hypothetical protein Dda_7948 [Drechslerella dactyloides]